MKTPLIRAGAGPDGVVAVYETWAKEQTELRKMINLANATETEQEKRHRGVNGYRSAAGDEDRLRMLPVHAPGVAGAIPGTRPDQVRFRE